MKPQTTRHTARRIVAASVALLATMFGVAVLGANAASAATVPAPTNFTQWGGNGVVYLAWYSGGGSTEGFNIYRSTTSTVALTNPINGSTPKGAWSYQDTNVVGGTKYWYVIQAVDGVGGHAETAALASTPTGTGTVTPTPTPTPTPTQTTPTPTPTPAPGAPSLTATAGTTSVALAWTAGTGGAVANWDVYRSTTSPLNTATATKIGNNLAAATLATTDVGLSPGTYYYVVVAKNATASVASTQKSATIVATTNKPKLVMSNPDAVPGSDRFVMSRMQYYATPTSMLRILDPDASDYGTLTWYGVHDVATIHLDNTGTADATVTGLVSSSTQVFTTSTALPLVVPAGGSVDIPVRFVYLGSGTACTGSAAVYGPMVCRGSLTVQATGLANLVAPLSGQWSPGASREAGLTGTTYCYMAPVTTACKRTLFEPWLTQVVNGEFGFGTNVGATTFLNSAAPSARFGDETRSQFWSAADPTAPVTVTRLSAASGAGLGAVRWYPASNATGCATSSAPDCGTVYPGWYSFGQNPDVADPNNVQTSQGVLPFQPGQPRTKSFTPGTASFGLKMNSEYSDWTRNDISLDIPYGHCKTSTDCGQHMRWFPVKTSAGAVVPNTYFVVNDLQGQNLDFNDNVLMLTNVKPS